MNRDRIAPVSLVLLLGLLALPVTTREGIDYQVRERRIPLGLKGLQFVLRDLHYRQCVREIAGGLSDEEERVQALLDWTRERIRPTPEGRPVRDDHIEQIIRRGYGEEDQRADVFTTLATYAGSPAFWKVVRSGEGERQRVLSFVRIGGQWTAWDVAQGRAYPDEVGLDDLEIPRPLRAEKQMVIPRILFEMKRFRNSAARWFTPRA